MQINHNIDNLLTSGAPIHTINERLACGYHTSTYKALTCKYQHDSSQAGSSHSVCAVTALNCVRLAFQLEAREGNEETILQSFFSQEMMNQVMNIVNDLFDNDLEIDDLLEVPIFKETVISTFREQGHPFEIKDLFIQLFPPESLNPIIAVVFTQTTEHLVCFRFRSSVSYIFAIFDAHSRSEHPFGPAFILASDVDTIITQFNQLLTQPSVSKSASKQDLTANHSFTAHVIKSRQTPLTIDVQGLLTKSVAFLSEKLTSVNHTPSSLDVATSVSGPLEQLRVRAETLWMHKLAHSPHKQDNNRQSGPSTRSTRRSGFGWQLNLQVSSTPSAVEPKNNNIAESSRPFEVKKSCSTTFDYKSEFDWLRSIMPGPRLDGEDDDISLSSTAPRIEVDNIPDNTLLHMCSRTEFGWQLALQQTSKTDRRKPEDLGIMASAVVSQADIQMHRVLLGKGKEASDEIFATQTLPKRSARAWEDVLMMQLQEEEELVASSAGFLSQESAWYLALRKRLETDEDNVDDAVASSSSSHAQLGRKEIISPNLHDLDSKPLPTIEGESSTMHPRHSPIFPAYFDTVLSSSRTFTTLELPTSEFPAESYECGVCNELYSEDQTIQLPTCSHTFCRECLRTYTKTKINEGRYPIFCPVCAIERTRVNQSHVTQAIVDKLDFSKQDLDKLDTLQLMSHSVTFHCPKCKQSTNVDRGEYASQRIITCPLPACRHSWCKECLKPLANSQTEHNCKLHGFERLMRKKGWKYCPGCKTPVQKESGCNHMTCGSPGCNVHFCYRCGDSIIDTSNGGDVGTAVTEHYLDCTMFEKRRRCTIQ